MQQHTQNDNQSRMHRLNGSMANISQSYPTNQYQQQGETVVHRPHPRMPYAGGSIPSDSRYPTFMPSVPLPQQTSPSSMPETSFQDSRFMRGSSATPPPNVPTSRSASRNSFTRAGAQSMVQQGPSSRPINPNLNINMSTAHGRYADPRMRPSYDGAANPSNSRPHMPNMPASAPIVPHVDNTAAHHRLSVGAVPYSPMSQGENDQSHHSSRTHNVDDCPGCQQDFEAALKASEASAREENERREQMRREEENHWKAVRASEEDDRRRKEAEEEMLRLVIAESQREEEEARIRRLREQQEEEEHRLLLLEESRQSALREDEERIARAHAELLERSKREAEEMDRRRKQEEERLQAMEVAIVEQSRREMEEEWKRRDEEERAMEEYAQKGGKQGEAAYWQHLQQNQAYDLAVQMNQNLSTIGEESGSSRTSRRPLPPTPGLAAQAAGVESPSAIGMDTETPSWEHDESDWAQRDSDGEDPFGDGAEAPPSYDEVRTDRPPEAPATIPDHIQFAPPIQAIQAHHNNTLAIPINRSEKTPISPNLTPRPIQRELHTVQEESASTSSTPPLAPAITSASLPEGAHSSLGVINTLLQPLSDLSDEQTEDTRAAILPNFLNRTESESSLSSASASIQHDPSRRTSASTIQSEDSSRSLLQQRAMRGTEFGYCKEPFSSNLALADEEADRKHFPSVIQLRKPSLDGSLTESKAYFVILAPSWKMLLRALAWYGNTRIEAGPEEVADSNRSKAIKIRLELEFVTPSKVEVGNLSRPQETINHAHVSVCMSLLGLENQNTSNSLSASLKSHSRDKDAIYLRRGSTRRVITLPSHAPVLPLAMVRLAQHLHQAHVFSAACPSTSSSALHSPRDLTRAIDKHDHSYVAKLQKLRKEAEAAMAANTNGGGDEASKMGKLKKDEDDEIDDHDAFDAGAVGSFEGGEGSESKMSRMKAKMKRKLAKRSGEINAVDQDLESWITPFDVNQHG